MRHFGKTTHFESHNSESGFRFFSSKIDEVIDRTKSILTAKYQVQKLGGLMADRRLKCCYN